MITPTIDLGQLCEGPSDESLMQSIAERQQTAMASLFQRHGKTLRKIIYQVLQDEAESDDVLQESILQVWREAKSYSAAIGKPLGWIVTIARRRAIDRVRRRAAYSLGAEIIPFMEDSRPLWAPHVLQSKRTDAQGRVVFESLKPGDYWLMGRTESADDAAFWNQRLSVNRGENRITLDQTNALYIK